MSRIKNKKFYVAKTDGTKQKVLLAPSEKEALVLWGKQMDEDPSAGKVLSELGTQHRTVGRTTTAASSPSETKPEPTTATREIKTLKGEEYPTKNKDSEVPNK